MFSPSFVQTVGLTLIGSVAFSAGIFVFDVSLMLLLTNFFDGTFAFVGAVSDKAFWWNLILCWTTGMRLFLSVGFKTPLDASEKVIYFLFLYKFFRFCIFFFFASPEYWGCTQFLQELQLIQLIWISFLFLVTFTGDRILGWCLMQTAQVQRQYFNLKLSSGKAPLWLLRFLIWTVVYICKDKY